MYLLKRMLVDIEGFLSESQAGFRAERGTRDNVLVLSMLMDEILAAHRKCVVTFIDFCAAFDTVSHNFLDEALEIATCEAFERRVRDFEANAGANVEDEADAANETPDLVDDGDSESERDEGSDEGQVGASRPVLSWKCRAVFRAIYSKASAKVRVTDSEGKHVFSETFPVRRGVVQGDIFSPLCFIVALELIMRRFGHEQGCRGEEEEGCEHDCSSVGVFDGIIGQAIESLVLLYADDAALVDADADSASRRVQRVSDGGVQQADMEVLRRG
jgi:hypothetical protein